MLIYTIIKELCTLKYLIIYGKSFHNHKIQPTFLPSSKEEGRKVGWILFLPPSKEEGRKEDKVRKDVK